MSKNIITPKLMVAIMAAASFALSPVMVQAGEGDHHKKAEKMAKKEAKKAEHKAHKEGKMAEKEEHKAKKEMKKHKKDSEE
ncbi:MAG: hypothetical protein KAI89_07185 [Emcibacter sp.]|nr:hypothetical protein [Emcibacter sp.]